MPTFANQQERALTAIKRDWREQSAPDWRWNSAFAQGGAPVLICGVANTAVEFRFAQIDEGGMELFGHRLQPEQGQALDDACDAQIIVRALREPVVLTIFPIPAFHDARILPRQAVKRKHAQESEHQIPAQQFVTMKSGQHFIVDHRRPGSNPAISGT